METVKKPYVRILTLARCFIVIVDFNYTPYDYKAPEERYTFTKSMSRVGRCLDNQPIEHFWGTFFKEEKFYQEHYQNFDELKKSVCSYIRYYNNYRYSEALNELSPTEFRKQAT